MVHHLSRFLLLALLLLPLVGHAAQIFVSTSGTDNSSCGDNSGTGACRTVSYASNTRSNSGDTITIMAGTYDDGGIKPKNGTGDSTRTIIQGDPNTARTNVILRPSAALDCMFYGSDGSQYITIQHLTMDGSPPGSGSPDGDNRQWKVGHAWCTDTNNSDTHHHITYNDVEIRYIRKSCMITSYGYNYRLTNSYLHHCGRRSQFCSDQGYCIAHNDDHGLYWQAHDSVIQNNIIYAPTGAWGAQNYGGSDVNNVWDRNEFRGGTDGCLTVTSGSNIQVTNNVCYASAPYTGHLGDDDTQPLRSATYRSQSSLLAQVGTMKVYNNTFDGTDSNGFTEVNSDASDSNIVFYNNIFCSINNTIAGNATQDKNVTTCSVFTNRSARQYTLAPGSSSVIDQGRDTRPEVTQDKAGNTRSLPYDIGAYESGSGGAAVPTSLQFGQQPTTTPATAPITPPMTVIVRDQNDNPMGTGTQQITLALQTPLPPGGGTLAGTVQRNAAGGTATFDNISVSAAATGYQLQATSTGLTQAVSDPFNITAPVRTGPIVVYVAPGALNDSQPCESADITHPRKTLAGGLACLTVPGDTLMLRAGTYNECIDTQARPIKGGTSESVRTTISAYSTEVVTLTLPPSCQSIAIFQNSSEDHYITLNGLTLDSLDTPNSNGLVYYPGTHHIRFQNGTIKRMFYEGVFIADASDNEVIDSTIDTSQFYGVNVTGTSTRTLLKGLTIKNHANAGVQVTNGSIFSLLQSTLTANGTAGSYPAIRVGGSGNSGSAIMNTVVYGNYAGLDITSGASGLKLYHLTVANNTNVGIQIANGAINTNLFNTISTGHGGGQNLANNAGASTVQGGILQTNPGFTNPGGGDFTLQPTATTAIDQGVVLTEVTTDRTGTVTRPQGGGYDIGAYECPAPCTTGPGPSTGVQLTAPAWKSGGLLRR